MDYKVSKPCFYHVCFSKIIYNFNLILFCYFFNNRNTIFITLTFIQNQHVHQISSFAMMEHVFQKTGLVMESMTVLTVLMKMQSSVSRVHSGFCAPMDVVQTWTMCVMELTIVETTATKIKYVLVRTI